MSDALYFLTPDDFIHGNRSIINLRANPDLLTHFRHLVECREVVCPVSGKRYQVERVLPLLALNCTTAIPDHLLPTRVLRHCIPMALPHTSPATCQYIIKVGSIMTLQVHFFTYMRLLVILNVFNF